jgi:hypothetical protein
MKKIYLFLFGWLFFAASAFAQGEAGEDKIICKDDKVQIGTPPQPDLCYSWKAGY